MKRVIYGFKSNWLIYATAVMGVLLIALPHYLVKAVPYVLAAALIAYACVNLYRQFQKTEGHPQPGQFLIYLVVGIVCLLQRGEALGTLGVLWAVMTLVECGEEIDEFFEHREINPFKLVWMLISIVLAVMLMHDPFEHFVFHMRILGLEIIFASFMHWRELRKA